MRKAAVVTAAVGGILGLAAGLLWIVLGGLAGLAGSAEDSDEAIRVGLLETVIGAAVLAGTYFGRRRRIVLALLLGAAAVAGLLVETILWPLIALPLAAGAVMSVLALRERV